MKTPERIKSHPLDGRPEAFWAECLALVPDWARPQARERLLREYRTAIGKDASELSPGEKTAICAGAGFRLSPSRSFFMLNDANLNVVSVNGDFFVEIAVIDATNENQQ